jgi:hypothetical protein
MEATEGSSRPGTFAPGDTAGRAPEPAWMLWQVFGTCRGSNLRFLGHQAPSHSDIHTELLSGSNVGGGALQILRKFVRWVQLLRDCDTQPQERNGVGPFFILKQNRRTTNEARINGYQSFL